ncbi:hypothetical protein KUTeg_003555 [Tegillarca granosa]|uniref:Uncharacterized protein n=1 Tax=Tegillarca granosa TaxID=220873 RepID=A0ABQ9FMF5_TEGGR|nr:hypothetical protein KUTeg_003555 [Tegillarca granosa]
MPSDTKAFLLYLRNLFPLEKFEHRLPPIMLKHQLYSLINNRTMVDKQLNDLKVSGEVKLFKLGNETDLYGVVFTDDYRSHVIRVMAEVSIGRNVTERFVNTIIKHCHDMSINKDTLMVEYLFTDEEITQLVKASVLTVRDIGSWWIAVPNAGMYVKSFQRGRKAVLTMIRKCKYKEILRKVCNFSFWFKPKPFYV